jgi:hypothetical protein
MKQKHTQTARMDCDGIARYYEALEHLAFGERLEQRRLAFLGAVRTSQRAIVCGGGDGRFLARLLRANPRVHVDFIELSPRMLELADRRIGSMGRAYRKRVNFHAVDVREFCPRSERYDLIVTHFFLDCFSELELESVVAILASWGAPGVQWIVSDFREAQGVLNSLWTRGLIAGLYAAFRLTTGLRVTRLPNYEAAIERAGYVQRLKEERLDGLLHSSLWDRCIRGGNLGTGDI